jgi:hypothetical protein
MESGMGVDLQKRGASRHRLLLTGQAIVPVLIILTTTVSCSRRAAEMPEPPYRIVERILPFSGSSSDEENRQLVQRRSDARPTLQQDQHRTSPPPKVAKVHCAGYEQRIRLRAMLLERRTRHRFSIPKKRSCSNYSSNGRKRQTDVP